MLIDSSYNKKRDYLKDIQQDYIVAVNTVHDEINFGMERYIIKPLIKRIIDKFTAKNIINRFGYPYINFLYDSEYNPYSGAFTGEGYEGVESFTPYTYSKSREEVENKKRFDKAVESIKSMAKDTNKEKTIKVKEEDFLKLGIKDLSKYTKKGLYDLIVISKKGESFIYPKKVNKKLLKKMRGIA